MLPYATDRELQRDPWATIGVLAACVLASVAQYTSPEVYRMLLLDPEQFHWWSMLTTTLAQGSIIQLIVFGLFLWTFSSHLEDIIGPAWLLAIFVSTTLVGATVHLLTPTLGLQAVVGPVGMNGPVAAMLAIFVIRLPATRVELFGYSMRMRQGGSLTLPVIWAAGVFVLADLLLRLLRDYCGPVRLTTFLGLWTCAGVGVAWALLLPALRKAADEAVLHEAGGFAAAGTYGAAGMAVEEQLLKRPNDPQLRLQAAHYFQHRGKTLSRALEHYTEAIRLLLKAGRPVEALAAWEKAATAFTPEQFDPGVVCDLAVAADNAGECAIARELYQAVATSHPNSRTAPTAAFRLAAMLERTGDAGRAQEWYRAVIKNWPNSQEELDAEVALKRMGRRLDDR